MEGFIAIKSYVLRPGSIGLLVFKTLCGSRPSYGATAICTLILHDPSSYDIALEGLALLLLRPFKPLLSQLHKEDFFFKLFYRVLYSTPQWCSLLISDALVCPE